MFVDLQKIYFYEKVLFSTQLSYHLMRKLLKNSLMVSIVYWPFKLSKALSFWSVELRTRLLFDQLLITKTTAEELVSETDSKEALYDASYEAPLTRKIGLNI